MTEVVTAGIVLFVLARLGLTIEAYQFQHRPPDERSRIWRNRVRRLADEFHRVGREEFRSTECAWCGAVAAVNVQIFPEDEPLPCCDGIETLYGTESTAWTSGRRRDAYWYACCVDGVDPDSGVNQRVSEARQQYLDEQCRRVGLRFGERAAVG